MGGWKDYAVAMAWCIAAAVFGGLYLVASWEGGRHSDDTNVLAHPIAVFVLLVAAGMLLHRWLSPLETAAVALAFLLGLLVSADFVEEPDPDAEGVGRYPGLWVFPSILATGAAGAALLGHGIMSVLRRQARRLNAP